MIRSYMRALKFDVVGKAAGLVMKEKNTVIQAWPLRFKFGLPTQEAKNSFALHLSSSHTGQERYVEWEVCRGPKAEDIRMGKFRESG